MTHTLCFAWKCTDGICSIPRRVKVSYLTEEYFRIERNLLEFRVHSSMHKKCRLFKTKRKYLKLKSLLQNAHDFYSSLKKSFWKRFLIMHRINGTYAVCIFRHDWFQESNSWVCGTPTYIHVTFRHQFILSNYRVHRCKCSTACWDARCRLLVIASLPVSDGFEICLVVCTSHERYQKIFFFSLLLI